MTDLAGSMADQPVIAVRNLAKFYGGMVAIENISFDIKQGEIVGLLGLNGAGKSTILKILGSFLVPSAGEAFVGGHSVLKNPDAIRRIIGYLPDTPPLYDEMLVSDYLSYVARLKNVQRRDRESYVQEAVEKTGLTDVLDARLGELSHGYRQRAGIAQAIIHKPKLLILDEPINGLDPVQIVEMRDLIKSLAGEHTVILSSHILSEITRTCDRIVIIHRGRVMAEGSEHELAGRMSSSLRLSCEVEKVPADLIDRIRSVEGVVSVRNESKNFVIETSKDVRAVVAQLIVESGAGLLGLEREQDGLERLFVSMVNQSRH